MLKYKKIKIHLFFAITWFISVCQGAEELEKLIEQETKEARAKVKTVRALAIDGGALRGAIPGKVLKEIEEKTGQPISKLFHIAGGTSIGCMLAAGLSVASKDDPLKPKWSADDLVQALYDGGPNIFRKRIPWGSVYDVGALERVVDQYCGTATFDQSIIPTVGITFNCWEGKTKAICSWEKEEVFLTRDAVLASSAVPFLFYPRLISPVNFNAPNNRYFLADGFLGANNPTAIVIAQAKKLFPNVEKFEILSLGNGVIKDPLYYRILKGTGTIAGVISNSLLRIFDIGLNVVSSDEYFKDMAIGNYTRINPIVSSGGSPFDPSKKNLDCFQQDANDYLGINKEQFDELIERLKKPKD